MLISVLPLISQVPDLDVRLLDLAAVISFFWG